MVSEISCPKGGSLPILEDDSAALQPGDWSMTQLMLVLSAVSFLSLLWLHVESRAENEQVAVRRSAVAMVIIPLFFLLLGTVAVPGWIIQAVALMTGLVTVILLVPTGAPQEFEATAATERQDERAIMFSRAALKPGTGNFEKYYEEFPQHRESDDRWRKLPGLMSSASGKYERLSFTAAGASFETVEQLKSLVEGPAAEEKQEIDSDEATTFIKGWLKKLGAVSSGVTLLKDEHLYTIKGRGESWGQPIKKIHRYAIAFSVEMDHRQMGTAPEGPTLMESAEQYLHAGAVAAQIAVFIRRLGWEAEAHIDANYKVICPLVAKDAGLGEIGRMGLLMTPELGPRVRLGVITTDLPLNTNETSFDASVLHFCSICKKCADVCPPSAIPMGDRELIDGNRRWRLNSEACFTYWCAMGTDCGQCMRVCPYSHPNTLLHRLVRRGISNSVVFRHFALRMDDVLYGRRPRPMKPESWLPKRS